MKLLSWNVDFMAANSPNRLRTVVKHIQETIFKCPQGEQPEPCCILLQEVHPDAFPVLLESRWLRDHFVMTPTKAECWPYAGYGNVTLVARTLPVRSASILAYRHTAMGRHAVLVDVRLGVPGVVVTSESESSDLEFERDRRADEVTVRVGNVHLESLPQGAAYRPVQLAAVAQLLREPGVDAGVVAGDMNVISQQDESIHAAAGLQDACTEGGDETYTWGYQPPSRFPTGRLDRVFYEGDGVCVVDKPERVGVGLKTPRGQWASDHFGLLATVRVVC